ncbi:unnamed protein product [Ceutorhynchus assimilis]|uniref:Choline transporter-like protein n=1 Tax=Ceutorhynchus assimilis TaxID=467358 RepID=A0A9N9MSV0_9CUCU|nr:unnamed protein product [Ceutorhynchus assimilis]
MGLTFTKLDPYELITFKELSPDVPLENIEVPERGENRKPTDFKWLVTFGLVILLFLPFFIYTMCYSDITRLTVGYDQCGNICGEKNSHWSGIDCSGKDFTDYPYLEFQNSSSDDTYSTNYLLMNRSCVQTCRLGYTPREERCIKMSNFNEIDSSYVDESDDNDVEEKYDVSLYLSSVKWQITVSCLLSLLVSVGMLFLFRFSVHIVVWGTIYVGLGALVFWTVAAWYFYFTATFYSTGHILAYALLMTLITIAFLVLLVWFRTRVHLVIMILGEAVKAVFDMPGLIVVPITSTLAIFILSIIFLLTMVSMLSAGNLENLVSDYYVYMPDSTMTFTIIYNCVIYLWLTQFFTGIQYMVVAGAVSKWYFARDKLSLRAPIFDSLAITFKFHLGSVAIGSLLITLVQTIKILILSLIKNRRIRSLVEFCIDQIETFFKFLSKNAYIVTAIHGQPFLKSGRRAARLLAQNIGEVIAVNSIGDFVLGMVKVFIFLFTILLSVIIFAIFPNPYGTSNIPAYMIIGIVAIIVACLSFGVFETTIDTLFVCYCEDNLLNDGMSKPYYMSNEFMGFMEKSREVYGEKEAPPPSYGFAVAV